MFLLSLLIIWFCEQQDLYDSLTKLLLHDQKWKCSMLFNEEEPTSKLPKIVNILDTLEKGVDYVFPQRFGGREAKNQVKVELN